MQIRIAFPLLPEQREILLKVVSIQTKSILNIYEKLYADPEYHDELMDMGFSQDKMLDNLPDILAHFEKIKENPEDWEVPMPIFYLVKYIIKLWTPEFLKQYPEEGQFILFDMFLKMSEIEFGITTEIDDEGNMTIRDKVTNEIIQQS